MKIQFTYIEYFRSHQNSRGIIFNNIVHKYGIICNKHTISHQVDIEIANSEQTINNPLWRKLVGMTDDDYNYLKKYEVTSEI